MTRAVLAEIRGWIQRPPAKGLDSRATWGPGDEDEYFYYVSLDTGWTPAPEVTAAGITPINTPQAIARYIPTFNIATFGGRALSGGQVWGGLGTAVIHIEFDAWGPRRTVDVLSQPTYPDVDSFRPPGWSIFGTYTYTDGARPGTYNVYFPFSPYYRGGPPNDFSGSPYVGADYITSSSSMNDSPTRGSGDYVRVVGLLWEDEPHLTTQWTDWNTNGGADAHDTKNCWDGQGYNHTRGWAEMHSIDYIIPIEQPENPHPIAYYESCITGSQSVNFRETVVPPKPYLNSYLAAVNAVRSDYFNTQASDGLAAVNLAAGTFDVSIQQCVGGFLSGCPQAAGFSAAYEVVWGCNRSSCVNTCFTNDGCGNPCSNPITCPAGTRCGSAGTCVCAPSCPSGTCGGEPDGCGGKCPTVTCGTAQICSNGQCIPGCPGTQYLCDCSTGAFCTTSAASCSHACPGG